MSCSRLSFFASAISFSKFYSKSYRDYFSISLIFFGSYWNLAPIFISLTSDVFASSNLHVLEFDYESPIIWLL